MRHLLILTLLLCTQYNYAQHACTHTGCHLKVVLQDAGTYVPPPVTIPNPSYSSASSSTMIIVNYTGFGAYPQAQVAFQYAVDIWEALLPINEPIIINATFASLGNNVLGTAGPSTFTNNFPNAPQPSIFYPIALANTLAGTDLAPNLSDITATFSNQFNWYYGIDGNPPAGTADFVSVVLHELGHGLGYLSSFSYDDGNPMNGTECNGTAGIGCVNVPNITFDQFLERSNGTLLNTYPNSSAAMGSAQISDDVFWGGASGMAASPGSSPKIHAPNPYVGGSSISHLDESTYPSGDPNSLMTATIFLSEAIHDPGPITLGMLADIGWPFPVCVATETVTGPFISGLYEANNLVQTSGSAIVLSSATFHSSQQIDMNNDFQVSTGATFTADIQPCGTPAMNKQSYPSSTVGFMSMLDAWLCD